MRRTVIVVCLLVVGTTAFAVDDSAQSELQINLLIDDGLYRNFDTISSYADGLSDEQRYMLFTNNEDEPMVPFIVNVVAGLGIGSFIQGDVTGGIIGAGLDVAGIGLTVYGSMAIYMALLMDPTNLAYSPTAITMSVVGYSVLLTSRVYQLIRPFSYSRRYNDDLRDALHM
jgi:hypothetical protein